MDEKCTLFAKCFCIFYYKTYYNTDKDVKNVDLCDETLCSFAGIYSRLE